jgi:hypothetical protein
MYVCIMYVQYILDLNFAPIKGSVFLTFFLKSQIRCTLRCMAYDCRKGEVAGCQGKLVRKGLGMGKDACEIVDYLWTIV